MISVYYHEQPLTGDAATAVLERHAKAKGRGSGPIAGIWLSAPSVGELVGDMRKNVLVPTQGLPGFLRDLSILLDGRPVSVKTDHNIPQGLAIIEHGEPL